jgi:hypothetical protein
MLILKNILVYDIDGPPQGTSEALVHEFSQPLKLSPIFGATMWRRNTIMGREDGLYSLLCLQGVISPLLGLSCLSAKYLCFRFIRDSLPTQGSVIFHSYFIKYMTRNNFSPNTPLLNYCPSP